MAFSRSLVRATSTTKRVWVPALTVSSSSFADTSNVDLAPLDRGDADRDLHRAAGERRRQMLERDLHADRILARVGVLRGSDRGR